MEHVTEVNAYGTLPKRGQELFIHSRKNHIAELIKANNNLELEIVALERSWHDIGRRSIHDSVGMAASPYGSLIAWLTCGVSTVLVALVTEKALISNLQQRSKLKQRLEKTRRALEKGRAQLSLT
jgi:hypothetical protein